MAKVKITGHASGTGVVTVTAPNTSTDRTITLPDATATIATTADVAARLPSIVDGGNSTAITINSAENVGIGVVPETWNVYDKVVQIGTGTAIWTYQNAEAHFSTNSYYNSGNKYIGTGLAAQYQQAAGAHNWMTAASGSADGALTWNTVLNITADGRGLSQFTAKAWVNFNGQGTPAIRDSHNVSSLTDQGVGRYDVNFTNSMADGNYSAVYDARSVNNNNGNASYVQTYSTSFLHVKHYEDGTNYDSEVNSVIVFGD